MRALVKFISIGEPNVSPPENDDCALLTEAGDGLRTEANDPLRQQPCEESPDVFGPPTLISLSPDLADIDGGTPITVTVSSRLRRTFRTLNKQKF